MRRKVESVAEGKAGVGKGAAVKRKVAKAAVKGKEVVKKKKEAEKAKKWFSPKMGTTTSKGLSEVKSRKTSKENLPKKC